MPRRLCSATAKTATAWILCLYGIKQDRAAILTEGKPVVAPSQSIGKGEGAFIHPSRKCSCSHGLSFCLLVYSIASLQITRKRQTSIPRCVDFAIPRSARQSMAIQTRMVYSVMTRALACCSEYKKMLFCCYSEIIEYMPLIALSITFYYFIW